MSFGSFEEDIQKDFDYFLGHEWQRPSEDIHVVWENEGVLGVIILLNLNLVVFESQHGGLVIIYVTIVRGTKYGDN